MRVDVQVEVSRQTVTIELNQYARGLYEKWIESGDDSVFVDLADYIGDQVSDVLLFDIENVVPGV